MTSAVLPAKRGRFALTAAGPGGPGAAGPRWPATFTGRVAHDVQLPPEPEDVHAGREEPAEVEELRPAVDAVVVVDREVDEAEAGPLELLHELEADDAARVLQRDRLEGRAAHEAEVAVDVPDPELEEEPHQDEVDLPDDDPVPRVGAGDLVPVHDVDPFLQDREELLQLEDVVLAVAVRVEDEVLRRGREAAPERRRRSRGSCAW